MTTRFPEERLAVFTLAERSDLRAQLFSAEFQSGLPEFMRHNPVAGVYFSDCKLDPSVDVAPRRGDGLPWDSWVRTHVRVGATIVRVAPCSMVIAGTLAEWSAWTGMEFDISGPTIVAGALSPVYVSLEQDHAVYIEPNLWI